jgi:arylsulfatase A-like enzyme
MMRILLFALLLASTARGGEGPPNVVLFFCDDLGYADVGCFGGKTPTPNIDRLAAEGMRFTNFYVAQAVCSASRAALMTGCYSNRVSVFGALFPDAKNGLNPSEFTMPQMFKSRGYATAIYGKWHLGDAPQFLPTRFGFDEYFGLPYSNDMYPRPEIDRKMPELPLMENEKVIERSPDQRTLTTRYTERAVAFIEKNHDRPFFLYVPHTMPHVPLGVSEKFAGKSGHGMYGDVIQEIDWSVGQILDALSRHKLDDKTLVIFTSDNGPWIVFGDHAGSPGPFREGKATMFEGGARVPCVMRWPGKIPGGTTSNAVAATIDLLPTFARLAGGTLPADRIIDGKDIFPLMHGDANAKSPHDAYYFYWMDQLQAVRSGKWKLHFPHKYNKLGSAGSGGKIGTNTKPQGEIGLALYDLDADPGETTDVAVKNPQVVARLQALAEVAREDLGDSLTNRQGKNVRPSGKIASAEPTP